MKMGANDIDMEEGSLEIGMGNSLITHYVESFTFRFPLRLVDFGCTVVSSYFVFD